MKALRRARLNDATLVVGIDVAKQTHVAVAEGPDGCFTPPLAFKNTRAGFSKLEAWCQKHVQRCGTSRLVLGVEPTGHYGKPLEEWLLTRGYELHLVSTLNTKRAKEMLDNSPLKNDAKDAAVIADLLRQGTSKPIVSQEEVFVELRVLSELRGRLTVERTAYLNRLHRLLDLVFPELPALFRSLDGKAVLALLEWAPTPDAVLAAGIGAVETLLIKHSRGQLGRERAEAIVLAAEQSVGCLAGRAARKRELTWLVPRLHELRSRIQEVEQAMALCLERVPYAEAMLAMPYLGPVTLAALLGELGDLRRYQSAGQVLKMAGLNLYEKSSGSHKGRRRVTKRGRALLRKLLYLSASRMIAVGRPLHGLLAKTTTTPFPKVAVAGMRKLLRILFALARDGRPYEPTIFKVQPVGPALELAA